MAKDIPRWITRSSKTAYKNKWFKVQTDEVIRPDGQKSEYNIVISPSPVFIIARESDGDIYLIGQFRYAIGEYSLEVPAGSSEGKNLLEAAKRELQEETGLIASKWEKLGSFYSANGLLREKAYVYLATELKQTGKNEQDEEGIDQLLKVPVNKVVDMINNGEIKDGQTMCSLMLYLTKNDLIKP